MELSQEPRQVFSTLDLDGYKLPPIDLLVQYEAEDIKVDIDELNDNKNRIIQTLADYGIRIESIKATAGPTVTLYEITTEGNVRLSKIKKYEDDIALSLSALGVRVVAPMPDKNTIGIEIPNKDAKIVSMYSVLSTPEYRESTMELPIALGKTIENKVFMIDLAKAPHLLIGGSTGQGKTVGLDVIITSLLYKKYPAELKFVLIDPKMLEFRPYSIIGNHFLAELPGYENSIITDVSEAITVLNSLAIEMDNRYDLLMSAGVRTMKEYNEKFVNKQLKPIGEYKYMPHIVVVIDEFGDLIMTAGKEVELPIARIAQKAHRVGIHLIITTQRPTANIITETIKANFPTRVAFRVTSQMDSRAILYASGAEQLLGNGDMLFSKDDNMTRIQCAFIDTSEIERISEYIRSQPSFSQTFELPEYTD